MLNQLNRKKDTCFSRGYCTLFCLLHSEFDKNANSACKRQGVLVYSSWFSDLEFAFFVRGFGHALFNIFERTYINEKTLFDCDTFMLDVLFSCGMRQWK